MPACTADTVPASLIADLDRLRGVLAAAGEPRAAIRRLDDTIDYLQHLRRRRARSPQERPA